MYPSPLQSSGVTDEGIERVRPGSVKQVPLTPLQLRRALHRSAPMTASKVTMQRSMRLRRTMGRCLLPGPIRHPSPPAGWRSRIAFSWVQVRPRWATSALLVCHRKRGLTGGSHVEGRFNFAPSGFRAHGSSPSCQAYCVQEAGEAVLRVALRADLPASAADWISPLSGHRLGIREPDQVTTHQSKKARNGAGQWVVLQPFLP